MKSAGFCDGCGLTVIRMGRVHRIQIADGLYHVFSRGNQQDEIFVDEADYARFLRSFSQTVERFEWLCHGFCLMPNHYHLLLETPEPNLASGMHVLNLSYARYFNWRSRRPRAQSGQSAPRGRSRRVALEQLSRPRRTRACALLPPGRPDS